MKQIAIILPGGIDKPGSAHTIDHILALVNGLAEYYSLTIYSLSAIVDSKADFRHEKFPVITSGLSHHSSLLPRMLKLSRRLLTQHRQDNYQLIHGLWGGPSGFLAVNLGRLLRRPTIVSLQGGEAASVPEIRYGNIFHKRLRRITLHACRSATRLVALTRFQVNEIQRHGLNRSDINIIPFGVDTRRFVWRDKAYSPPYRFLHIANLTEVKDQATLLRAFRHIRNAVDCQLDIVGPDHLNGALHEFVATLNLENDVYFHGQLPREQLPAFYESADIMLHTSLYEGQGVVLAEAASSGVAICGTAVGLLADLQHQGMCAVAPGDAEGLAKTVLALLQSPQRLQENRRQAKEWATKYDVSWTIQQYCELYEGLLS